MRQSDLAALFYYTDDMIVLYKKCLTHNLQCVIYQFTFFKTSSPVRYRRHAPSFDSLTSFSSLQKFHDTTVDYIMVKFGDNFLTNDTSNSRSGTAIAT